jgi:hypothetical protein
MRLADLSEQAQACLQRCRIDRQRLYSSRSATMGSIREARRAGSQLASSAVKMTAAVMVEKTRGSLGLTS